MFSSATKTAARLGLKRGASGFNSCIFVGSLSEDNSIGYKCCIGLSNTPLPRLYSHRTTPSFPGNTFCTTAHNLPRFFASDSWTKTISPSFTLNLLRWCFRQCFSLSAVTYSLVQRDQSASLHKAFYPIHFYHHHWKSSSPIIVRYLQTFLHRSFGANGGMTSTFTYLAIRLARALGSSMTNARAIET